MIPLPSELKLLNSAGADVEALRVFRRARAQHLLQLRSQLLRVDDVAVTHHLARRTRLASIDELDVGDALLEDAELLGEANAAARAEVGGRRSAVGRVGAQVLRIRWPDVGSGGVDDESVTGVCAGPNEVGRASPVCRC